MANSTVYPYGTGGSLPASIGIINDLITGGADKALAAAQGPEIVELINEATLGKDWVTKDIQSTWEAGALIARANDSAYNTLVSDASWKTTDYVDVEDYTHLVYRTCETTSSSGLATRAGVIFYDSSKNPIMGFAGGYAAATGGSDYSIPIPATTKYVRISNWYSTFWSGQNHDKLAKKTGYAENKANIEKLSDIGIVGDPLSFTVAAGDNSTVVRNIIGNFVTEYRIQNVAFAYRLNIDISGRDMSKYYIVRFKYSCTRTIPNNVWVVLKDSSNTISKAIADPTVVRGTTSSRLVDNGETSGEYIGIIPPFLDDYTLFCIDTQNETGSTRMEFSNISINEFTPTSEIKISGVPLWQNPVEYSGEKIQVKNRVVAEKYMSITSNCQAMCGFGDYAFQHKDKGGSIDVYNLRTKQKIQTVTITGASANNSNHGNTVGFSNQYYESGDEFPIMYVSSGNAVDGHPKAYGLRIVKTVENDVETFAISLVHTITFDSTNWTEFVLAGDITYVRTLINGVSTLGKVVTPLASAGDVTISSSDFFYSVPYDDYLRYQFNNAVQGLFYHNNRIFTCWGQTAPYYFGVTNPDTGQITTAIPLADLGINQEPESVFYWDGYLFMNTYSGNLYRLHFD